MAEQETSELIVATPAKVAFDLMVLINEKDLSGPMQDRTYWLTLYRQCYKAATGQPLERILEEK